MKNPDVSDRDHKKKIMTRRELIAGISLGLAGFAVNWFKLPIFFNVDFLFGSILTMYALLRFGLKTGVLAAIIASTCTWFHWHHFWAIFIFSAEALVAGLLLRLRGRELLTGVILFWFTAGLALVWLFYHHVMGFAPLPTLLIALKQGINGILNTVAAEAANLVLWRFSLNRELPTLRKRLLVTLQGLVLVPAFIFIFLNINWQFRQQLEGLQQNTTRMAEVGKLAVSSSLTELGKNISILANLIKNTSIGFALATAVVVALLLVQGFLITAMQTDLNSLRQPPSLLHNVLTTHQKAMENRATVEPLISILNSQHAESSIPALLATVTLTPLTDVTISSMIAKRDKEAIQLSFTGEILKPTLAETQLQLEAFGTQLLRTKGIALGNRSLDPNNNKFSMEATHKP